LQFFQGRAGLGFLDKYRPKGPRVDFVNVDPLVGAIVESGKATLQELKTVYTLEEALDIFEVIAVGRYNEWLAAKEAEKGR